MNQWRVLRMIVMVFLMALVGGGQVAYGESSKTIYDIYSNEEQGELPPPESPPIKTNDSLVPHVFKFFVSFGVIIVLLLVFLRFLKSKSKHIRSQGPFHSIAGHPLGSNRSLQLVMVGNTLYVLGVGNDVQLLRAVEPGEEQDVILSSLIEASDGKQFSSTSGGGSLESWEKTFTAQLNRVKQFTIKKLDDDGR